MREKVDETIINVCKWIDKNVDEADVSLTISALAELVNARTNMDYE